MKLIKIALFSVERQQPTSQIIRTGGAALCHRTLIKMRLDQKKKTFIDSINTLTQTNGIPIHS